VDLAAVFLLSLLGGYYFASLWRLTAFATRRVEGHHLYFRAALCGVICFAAALLLRTVLIKTSSWYPAVDEALVSYVKPILKEESGVGEADQIRRAQWVITAGYSLVLAIMFAGLFNILTPRRWALYRSAGALDKLLMEAQRQDLPVSLTLTSEKVYIGVVIATPDPNVTPSVVTILPMFSGHRDELGRLGLTTDYETLYTSLHRGRATQLGLPDQWLSQFRLTIPAESIVTAALFSPAVYAEFNPLWKQQIAERNRKPPPQELLVEIKEPKTQPWKPRRV
jgi:hypothetical protein